MPGHSRPEPSLPSPRAAAEASGRRASGRRTKCAATSRTGSSQQAKPKKSTESGRSKRRLWRPLDRGGRNWHREIDLTGTTRQRADPWFLRCRYLPERTGGEPPGTKAYPLAKRTYPSPLLHAERGADTLGSQRDCGAVWMASHKVGGKMHHKVRTKWL